MNFKCDITKGNRKLCRFCRDKKSQIAKLFQSRKLFLKQFRDKLIF